MLVVLRSALCSVVLIGGLALGAALVPSGHFVTLPPILFAVALGVGFTVVVGANQLLRPSLLFNFVSRHYHRPRVEDRVLLFESSTEIAVRLG